MTFYQLEHGFFAWRSAWGEGETVATMKPGDVLIPKYASSAFEGATGGGKIVTERTTYMRGRGDSYADWKARYEKAAKLGVLRESWTVTSAPVSEHTMPQVAPNVSFTRIDVTRRSTFDHPLNLQQTLALHVLPIELRRQIKNMVARGRHVQELKPAQQVLQIIDAVGATPEKSPYLERYHCALDDTSFPSAHAGDRTFRVTRSGALVGDALVTDDGRDSLVTSTGGTVQELRTSLRRAKAGGKSNLANVERAVADLERVVREQTPIEYGFGGYYDRFVTLDDHMTRLGLRSGEHYFIFQSKPPKQSNSTEDWPDQEGERYPFGPTTSGRRPLLSAGNGRFVYYRGTDPADDGHPPQSFFGTGLITYVGPDGKGKFVAQLANYRRMIPPVPLDGHRPASWTNNQHSIVEITREEFDDIVGSREPVVESAQQKLEYEIDAADAVLTEVQSVLKDGFGGVILAGAPGTSKSWYAEQIGAVLVDRDPSRLRRLQFHPSYQYEDFVEGYRPRPDGEGFVPADRHLKLICDAARKDPSRTYVLLIDELSRSDPARVFGEALTYLETSRRGQSFFLASGNEFDIPKNVVFIATMNVFDRGVDEVDAAFERRFARIDMTPSVARLSSILGGNGMEANLMARVVKFFNWLQNNGDARAKVGHAYFIHAVDLASLNRLWNHSLKFVFEKAYLFNEDGLKSVTAAWNREVVQMPENPAADAQVEQGSPVDSSPPATATPIQTVHGSAE